MTAFEMLDYLLESGCFFSIADIAHQSKVSCSTLYRILNQGKGTSEGVMQKLRILYDDVVEDEIKTASGV